MDPLRVLLPLLMVILAFLNGQFVTSKASETPRNNSTTNSTRNEKFFQHPGVEVDAVLTARGYLAKNFKFTTEDGYVLAITRGRNPLINNGTSSLPNKDPLLFIHGTITNANEFIVNSFGAKPKDFSHIDLNELSRDEANELLGGEPSADSLPTLAMNFGHEVWFLHRRGTRMSRSRLSEDKLERKREKKLLSPYEKLMRAKEYARRFLLHQTGDHAGVQLKLELNSKLGENKKSHVRNRLTEVVRIDVDKMSPTVKPKKGSHNKLVPVLKNAPEALFNVVRIYEDLKITLDGKFWNYSLDEQAAYDLPNAIDFVRFKTGCERVAMIGHSGGGALVLMTHILNPKLSAKLSKTIAWGPSLILGHNDSIKSMTALEPLLSYIGPYPMPALSAPTQALYQFFCSFEVMQKTICEMFGDLSLGKTDGQAPYRPEFMTTHFIPASTKESVQHLQFARHGKPRLFDYGVAKSNFNAYEQITPPDYDPGYMTSDKISIWSSVHDTVISFEDIEILTSKIRVPHKLYLIDRKGIAFNHGSYTYHRDVARIVIIPSLMDIVSSRRDQLSENSAPLS